jgi:hypothetical protein
LIVGQPKNSGNWRKSHTSANQIPESPKTLIFSKREFLLFGLDNIDSGDYIDNIKQQLQMDNQKTK